MQDIFSKSEFIFRNKTVRFSVKIDAAEIVQNIIESSTIKSKFKTVCCDIDPKVDSEISMNLLEQMLTLFVRIRTFSFAGLGRNERGAVRCITHQFY